MNRGKQEEFQAVIDGLLARVHELEEALKVGKESYALRCNIHEESRAENAELMKEVGELRRIAAMCKQEIDHGFDLPSEVFESVETYYVRRVKSAARDNAGEK